MKKVKIANFSLKSRKHQSKMSKNFTLMFSDLKKKDLNIPSLNI